MLKNLLRRLSRATPQLITLGISIFISAGITQFHFHEIESFFYDLRFRLSSPTQLSNAIHLVAIDTPTIAGLQHEPLAKDLNQALTQIFQHNPRRVVITSHLEDFHGTAKEITELIETLKDPRVFIAVDELPLEGDQKSLAPKSNFEGLRFRPAPITVDQANFGRDGVTRRALLQGYGINLLDFELANSITNRPDPRSYQGTFDFLSTYQTYIDFRPTNSFPRTSFLQAYRNEMSAAAIDGKIILLGLDAKLDTSDYIKTPYSRSSVAMSKLEAHANAIETLIQDTGVWKTSNWVNIFLTVLVSCVISFAVLLLRPSHGLLILLTVGVTFSAACLFFFSQFRLWIIMTHPLLALFINYYLFIPYRLIQENRKSWEFQQKNRLLLQVEELKSNFMSMMSHDLKTPLARIQGMIEILKRNPQTMTPDQTQAIDVIQFSGEELHHFISSILNLSRIESKELKLNFHSKDINQLLEDVVGRLKFQAEQKNIQISTELEPLFSLRMDQDLMRQVFINLIENAIKYSPENSRVLVSTEETPSGILVQVSDQGRGIPREELPHIFAKFYRSKEVKNSPIKGSGLGLYLAKYFVELHHGTLMVESEPQQGSTFSVHLPLDGKAH